MTKRRDTWTYLRLLRHRVEAAIVWLALGLTRYLSLDQASALGGFIGRNIGARLGIRGRAAANLRLAFPGIDESEIRRITRASWDNLGRTFAEFPHLEEIVAAESGRVEVSDPGDILSQIKPGQAAIFVSGHFANWEAMAAMGRRLGLELNTVMREPNNPLLRPVLHQLRGVIGGRLVPKGQEGAKQLMAALRSHGVVAVLVDQKMNEGLSVPFFGVNAMTATGPARLALRFRCPVVPLRLERLGGARFRLICCRPLALPDSGDREADVLTLTTAMNAQLEDWIRELPEQWFWLHRRWPKEVYAAAYRRRRDDRAPASPSPG